MVTHPDQQTPAKTRPAAQNTSSLISPVRVAHHHDSSSRTQHTFGQATAFHDHRGRIEMPCRRAQSPNQPDPTGNLLDPSTVPFASCCNARMAADWHARDTRRTRSGRYFHARCVARPVDCVARAVQGRATIEDHGPRPCCLPGRAVRSARYKFGPAPHHRAPHERGGNR